METAGFKAENPRIRESSRVVRPRVLRDSSGSDAEGHRSHLSIMAVRLMADVAGTLMLSTGAVWGFGGACLTAVVACCTVRCHGSNRGCCHASMSWSAGREIGEAIADSENVVR